MFSLATYFDGKIPGKIKDYPVTKNVKTSVGKANPHQKRYLRLLYHSTMALASVAKSAFGL